jgi:hypothetical protein
MLIILSNFEYAASFRPAALFDTWRNLLRACLRRLDSLRADVPDADIVRHNDDDVWFLRLGGGTLAHATRQ